MSPKQLGRAWELTGRKESVLRRAERGTHSGKQSVVYGGVSAENPNNNPEQAEGPKARNSHCLNWPPHGAWLIPPYSLTCNSPQPLILLPTVLFNPVFKQAVVDHIKYLQSPRKPQECLEHLLLGYFGPLSPNPLPLQLASLSRSSCICCFYVILSACTQITSHHIGV